MELHSLIIIFLTTGVIAGLLAGFLGIGGGLVVVPLLSFALPLANVPLEHVMTIAVGTSLATIIFTAISSILAHHKRNNIIWPAVYSLFPGLMLGSMLGAVIGAKMDNQWMQITFGVFALCMAIYTFLGDRCSVPVWDYSSSRRWLSLVGFIIGGMSTIVGIGGGTLLGPWLIWLGLEARRSVGTSAACGLFIAIFGSVSYLIAGVEIDNLPEYSLGYIYLPAFLGIICTSMLTAPLGAKLASLFSDRIIKLAMGLALLVASIKMFLSLT